MKNYQTNSWILKPQGMVLMRYITQSYTRTAKIINIKIIKSSILFRYRVGSGSTSVKPKETSSALYLVDSKTLVPDSGLFCLKYDIPGNPTARHFLTDRAFCSTIIWIKQSMLGLKMGLICLHTDVYQCSWSGSVLWGCAKI